MAATFDAVSRDVKYGSSQTFSHTCSGSDRYLLVGVSSPYVTGVTYAGTAMSLISSYGTGTAAIRVYGLVAPAAGTNSVVVTLSGTALFNAIGVSLAGVDQTTPVAGESGETNGYMSTPHSVSVSLPSSGIAVDFIYSETNVSDMFVVGAGQTSISNVNINSELFSSSYDTTDGVMSWTWTSGQKSGAHAIIAFNAATGGGTPSLVVSDGAHAHTADNLALTIIGTLSIADASHAHTVDSLTLTAAVNGTITIPAVRDWGTKALKTGQTGVQVDIRNIATGALVVRKTGQTTHATTGVCVVTDAAIVAGTTYEVVTRFADGSRGMWDYTAS